MAPTGTCWGHRAHAEERCIARTADPSEPKGPKSLISRLRKSTASRACGTQIPPAPPRHNDWVCLHSLLRLELPGLAAYSCKNSWWAPPPGVLMDLQL